MFKKYALGLGLAILIGLGLAYAIFTSPELPEHQLFAEAIKVFSKNSANLEVAYQQQQKLPAFNQQFDLKYVDLNHQASSIKVKMTSLNNLVTLNFGQGESLLAEQSVILEPFFSDEEKKLIRWKCIGGTALIRLRTKDCRLGYGIDTKEINDN